MDQQHGHHLGARQNLSPTPGSRIRITVLIRCPDISRSPALGGPVSAHTGWRGVGTGVAWSGEWSCKRWESTQVFAYEVILSASTGGEKPLLWEAEQAVTVAAHSMVTLCVSREEERCAGAWTCAEPKHDQVFEWESQSPRSKPRRL